MKHFSSLILVVALLIGLVGCGGQETATLETKKAELSALLKERSALEQKIAALEAEIDSLGGKKDATEAMPVTVVQISPKTFQHFIRVQGQVVADNNVMVSPRMGGTYTQVLATEGASVAKGQLLAKVDDDVLRKSVDEINVQLSLARSLYQKQQNLWDQKIGSEVQLMQAKAQKDALEQRLATTQEQINMSRVVAPISGIVEQVMVKAGEGAIPGMPVCRIISLNDLRFKADLSEAYIPYIHKGDVVTIKFASIGAEINAKVNSIGQTVNPSNRTVTVLVDIPAGTPNIKANIVGEISINDATRENALTVPQEYIQKGNEGSYVMVAEADASGQGYVARKVPITTGIRSDNEVEAVSGLKVGHLLILEGYQNVRDGDKVSFSGSGATPAPAAKEAAPAVPSTPSK
jgi:membrane fusion protein (multidrug efflux system)